MHARQSDDTPIDDGCITSGELRKVYIAEAIGESAENMDDFCARNRLSFVRSSGSGSGIYGCGSLVLTDDGETRYYELSESYELLLDRETFRKPGSGEAVEARFLEAGYTLPPLVLLRATVSSSREADHA